MDITITRGEPYNHVVPGTYSNGWSESYQITELYIDGALVGVEAHGEIHDPCKRCGVGGHYSFNGHDSICYDCHGYSYGKETTEADIIRRYKDRQKAAAKRAAEAEKAAKAAADALAAWVAEHPALAEALVAHRSVVDAEGYTDFSFVPQDSFLTSLADQSKYKPLTPRQTEAALAALDRLAQRQARNAEKIAAGHWGTVGKRDTVTVKVVSCRFFENDFGGNWLVTMFVEDGGQTLKTWTSGQFMDTAIEAEKTGDSVAIKATVKEHGTYRDLPETTVTRVTVV